MPVLVAWGKDDAIVHFTNVEKIRSHLPRARYAVYEKAGHMLPYEVADQFSRDLVDLLRS